MGLLVLALLALGWLTATAPLPTIHPTGPSLVTDGPSELPAPGEPLPILGLLDDLPADDTGAGSSLAPLDHPTRLPAAGMDHSRPGHRRLPLRPPRQSA